MADISPLRSIEAIRAAAELSQRRAIERRKQEVKHLPAIKRLPVGQMVTTALILGLLVLGLFLHGDLG